VRNRAQPEGSIAEGYIAEECLTFASRYMANIETRFNRIGRVDDEPNEVGSSNGESIFPQQGKPVGSVSHFKLTNMEKLQAHRHVLMNCVLVDKYIK